MTNLPPRLPPAGPTIRHVYTETGWGGGSVKMNTAEKARAATRPWWRRACGLPSQAEVDSWRINP